MQNATVKDNILFGREMNVGKYDEVIEAYIVNNSDLFVLCNMSWSICFHFKHLKYYAF
jgi:hypothetical protein